MSMEGRYTLCINKTAAFCEDGVEQIDHAMRCSVVSGYKRGTICRICRTIFLEVFFFNTFVTEFFGVF